MRVVGILMFWGLFTVIVNAFRLSADIHNDNNDGPGKSNDTNNDND